MEPFHDSGGVHGVTLRCGLGLKQSAELGGVDLAALESGPGIVVRVGRVDASYGPRWEIHFSLVGGERVEWTGEDDTTEVK